MSEKNTKQSKVPLIATIVVTVLALAAVVALILILNKPAEKSPAPSDEVFRPTAEFEQECSYEAHDLVKESYEIIRLFITQGLPHLDEPYGNAPEDGIYTVNTEKSRGYASYEDIEKKVKSVYTDEAAEKVLHDIDGKGFEVYKKRTILVDNPLTDENAPHYKEAVVLGINADFKADTTREKLWESCSLAVLPTSETECDITIYLDGTGDSSDISSVSEDKILRTKMVKTDAGWRLKEFVY